MHFISLPHEKISIMANPECRLCVLKSPAAELLSSKELEILEFNCAQIKFKKGEMIFREGTLATNIIYLRSGLVKIHMKGPVRDKILRIMKAPSYLGLPTTFGEKVNHYSATALIESEVCFISLDTFRDFIFKNGGFAYEIILDLCRNELKDYQRYTNMSQKQLPGRLADILLCMSHELFDSDKFELPVNNNELSDFISTSRESVSRLLSEFSKEGIIKINKKELTILKKDMLEKISLKG
jgi:CRP-like cAMP-binding protein